MSTPTERAPQIDCEGFQGSPQANSEISVFGHRANPTEHRQPHYECHPGSSDGQRRSWVVRL